MLCCATIVIMENTAQHVLSLDRTIAHHTLKSNWALKSGLIARSTMPSEKDYCITVSQTAFAQAASGMLCVPIGTLAVVRQRSDSEEGDRR